MSPAELEAKRERDRRYAASYRARKRAEAAERARAGADGAQGEMRQSVEAALAAAKWIVASDAASVAQARALASFVDRAVDSGDVRAELRAHTLLSHVLADLGLTPRSRIQLEVRSRKLAVVESDQAPAKAPNVVRFPRPPKRRG
ncbi:terminase small subunit [Microbacterium schleiferi]|uniref:terminase small subunit n=1 Tax=Microbacterium schleiferi TaxID=69362 RepID=UPI00311F3C85